MSGHSCFGVEPDSPGDTVPGPPVDPFDPLWVRGIAPEIAAERGYVPYYGKHHPLYDPASVKRVFDAYDLTSGQRSTMTRFTNGARDESRCPETGCEGRRCACVGYGDGLIMLKHPFPGEPVVLPQLRPRYAVLTGGKTRHRHDLAFRDEPDRLANHLMEEHAGEDIADELLHEHENRGKYLLQSKAKHNVSHDHTNDTSFRGSSGRERLIQHLAASTGHGLDRKRLNRMPFKRLLALVPGEHQHRSVVPGQAVANRLEIHPRALWLLQTAETVYFALEGTLKADAILSSIVATGARASVLDVPSVTLWGDPSLERVAKEFLRGFGGPKPLVVIVVDADYHANERVVRQSLLLREKLRSFGVNACVAAPPADVNERGALLYKGVDDFLAAGGQLGDLVVLHREADFSLALHASADGTIRSSAVGLGPLLRCRRDARRVVEVLQRHIDAGQIAADRPLELQVDRWTGLLGWKGRREDWPTFTISPDCRYSEQFVALADFANRVPSGLTIAETFALEVGRVIHEAGRDRRWAEEPPARELFRIVFDEAVQRTAELLGKTVKTVRDNAEVAAMYNEARKIRDYVIRKYRGVFPVPMIASIMGVSERTVQQVSNTNEPVDRAERHGQVDRED